MPDFLPETHPRHLVLVLGDQLDRLAPVFADFDPGLDAVWMAENAHEATYVWSHKLRIAFFFSAMRHFRNQLRSEGITVHYSQISPLAATDRGKDFVDILTQDLERLQPTRVLVTTPGDWRVQALLKRTAETMDMALEIREDTHFYASIEHFKDWAKNRKTLVMEFFYRDLRRRLDILMQPTGEPEGHKWNYDHQNREHFPRAGPGEIRPPREFPTDALSQSVLQMVAERFDTHPGVLDKFVMPVTRADALLCLDDFIEQRLPLFGTYEDAMWGEEPFLYHSRLSALLNVKLLNPRECVDAAIRAYHAGKAPLNSVEGFVRQILGWREFIRGIYWLKMPSYLEMNKLNARQSLPAFFWDGNTDMNCVKHSMAMLIKHAYTHHIHRLMVLGLFSMLYGVHPKTFHNWHMAMYLDAIDWVSLPNTLGMSQHGDGGIVGTKPYCASGNYINRMSNYCKECKYNYRLATGEDACPFTTLYWDFLDRNRELLEKNHRMTMQYRNLNKKTAAEINGIRMQANILIQKISAG